MKHAIVLVALLLSPLAALHAADATPSKPNILFLFADDQRADTIAALGNPVIKTPNLDRLVQSGLVFNRAYMQGAFGGATCIPSRAMLMTGRSLFHIGTSKRGDNETWPAAFGRAGYATLVSGKWHNGNKMLLSSFQNGRSVFAKGMSHNPLNDWVCDLVNGKLTADRAAGKHLCASFADSVVQFLQQHKGGPFFYYVPFDAPHDPHIMPKDFPIHYDPAKIPLPTNFLPQHPFDNGDLTVRDEGLLPHPRTPQAVRELLADYYRYISYLDMLIGQVLDALEASPYAKNTIVVFSADSGVARGSHGLIGKQNLYEYDSVRVPLIIAGPGIPAGKRTEAMCYLYDLLPTLGAVCGVPAPSKSDGLNLSAVLRDPSRPGRSEMVFAYKDVQRAIATADWKLIRYPHVNQTQLFNLQDDPYEIHNLAGDPKQASRVAELSALMKKKLAEAGDNQLGRNDGHSAEE
jgi:arylsulfatase A-like enzyme